jgi:RNA polymerase-binding transcription factor DksA
MRLHRSSMPRPHISRRGSPLPSPSAFDREYSASTALALQGIQAINRALARIELGEYGACEVCGKESEVERLEAIPWTSVCSTHARTE